MHLLAKSFVDFHYPTPLALAIKNSRGLALKKLEKINSGVRKPVCHLNLK
jgi:hypothetical protein